MSYNLTIITDNATTVLGFVQGVNNVLMLGYLGVLLLISIAIVIFTSYTYVTNEPGNAFIATSWITMIFALIFRAAGLLPSLAFYIALLITAVVIAVSWMNSR